MLAHTAGSEEAVPGKEGIRVLRRPRPEIAEEALNVFVLAQAIEVKQSDIKGLSERQVRRIEKGEGTTFESLRRLAAAHGLDLKKYLDEVAKMIEKSDGS